MAYGLKILGNESNVQIDSEFSNYQIIAKGSAVSRITSFNNFQGTLITHPASVEPPLIFMRTANALNNRVTFVSYQKTGELYTGFRVWSYYDNTSFEYAVAARTEVAETSGWGMQVRQENTAKLQYDTGAPFLRITDFISISRADTDLQNLFPHAFTENPYYCVQPMTPYTYWQESPLSAYFGACYTSQGSVTIRGFTFGPTNADAGSTNTYGQFSPGYDNWGMHFVIVADID